MPYSGSSSARRSVCLARSGHDAFTLIELLTLVAIIALLSALLLPVLGRARESGRKVACINNLHQLAIASMTYAMDYHNHLPSFRDWLYVKPGDLTTGRLYPYLKSKPVYQCPTDRSELATKRVATPARSPQGFANRSGKRDYSYAMNCGICHATDISRFKEPSKTMIYMEGALSPTDYTGQVGPSMVAQSLAFRHNRRGHLVKGDLHVEAMTKKEFDPVAKTRLFWFPTGDASGPGGGNLMP